jgi:prolyl 4-hydroxylase
MPSDPNFSDDEEEAQPVHFFVNWQNPGSIAMPREIPLDISSSSLIPALHAHVCANTGAQLIKTELWFGVPPKYNLSDLPPETLCGTVLTPNIRLTLVEKPSDEKESERVSHDHKAKTDMSEVLDQPWDASSCVKEAFQLDDDEEERAFLLRNFLSNTECAKLIAASEQLGYEKLGWLEKYRSNERMVINDTGLAGALYERMLPFLPKLLVADGYEWTPCGLNECFRFCRYTVGQHFSRHTDGGFVRTTDELSIYTVNFYLNADFEGGATRFFMSHDQYAVTHSLTPETGLCMIFDHVNKDYLHDGERLRSGVKYLLRSDAMYRRGARAIDAARLRAEDPQESET